MECMHDSCTASQDGEQGRRNIGSLRYDVMRGPRLRPLPSCGQKVVVPLSAVALQTFFFLFTFELALVGRPLLVPLSAVAPQFKTNCLFTFGAEKLVVIKKFVCKNWRPLRPEVSRTLRISLLS